MKCSQESYVSTNKKYDREKIFNREDTKKKSLIRHPLELSKAILEGSMDRLRMAVAIKAMTDKNFIFSYLRAFAF